MKKIRLVSNWRQAWRWFSINCMTASAALLVSWVAMPDDLKTALPEWLVPVVAVVVLVLGAFGRLVDQSAGDTEK